VLSTLFARSRNGRRGNGQAEDLISMLTDAAIAVSSAMSMTEVLGVIAEQARQATRADKLAILLYDDDTGLFDPDSLVVRGMREQHPQAEWEERLDHIAHSASVGEIVTDAGDGSEPVLVAVPMRLHNEPIGVICAINAPERALDSARRDALTVLAAFAATAIESARLNEQTATMLLSSERERIAREIHDGVMQSLFSMSLALEVCKKGIYRDPTEVYQRLDELQDQLNMAAAELRRYIYDLKPARLSELGLASAVQYWIRDVTSGTPVRGRFIIEGESPSLTAREEACLYRVAKEAVSNAVRHAGAKNVDVRLIHGPGWVKMTVNDDGKGFDPDMQQTSGGMGLRSIRDRVRGEGGELTIESARGEGTRITVQLAVVPR
jgi:signal transduction histidine kinase